jgi:tetratricopeptide (TPR) repeat protein
VFSKIVDDHGKGPSVAIRLEGMPTVWTCSDPEWLARPTPPAVTGADREALLAAEQELARAAVLRDAGEHAKSTELVTTIRNTAMRLGDRSLAARASLLAVELDRDRGDLRDAETDAMDAWTAASAYGDMELTLHAQLEMLGAASTRDRSAIDGFAGLGKDATESAEGAKLVTWYGDALAEAGRFPEAEAQYRRAKEIRERVLPADHVDRALGLQKLGGLLAVEKRAPEALELLDQSQVAIDRAFPPLRREAIDGLRYRAMAEEELGHHDKALELKREILRRRTTVLGEGSGFALEARADIATTLGDMGRDAEAAAELEKVIAGHLALSGEKSVNAADARVELANRLITLGRYADADAALALAIPLIAKARGDDSPYVLAARYTQVRSYTERPHPIELARASTWLDQMEPVFGKLFGATSQPVAAVHEARARILLARGDAAHAEKVLAGARAMLDDAHRADRAEIELLEARALWKLGRRDEATAAAEAARQDYAAAGEGFADRAAAAQAWKDHPRS